MLTVESRYVAEPKRLDVDFCFRREGNRFRRARIDISFPGVLKLLVASIAGH